LKNCHNDPKDNFGHADFEVMITLGVQGEDKLEVSRL